MRAWRSGYSALEPFSLSGFPFFHPLVIQKKKHGFVINYGRLLPLLFFPFVFVPPPDSMYLYGFKTVLCV